MASFDAPRVFEPKAYEIEWKDILKVDVDAFQEGRVNEDRIREFLDDVCPILLSGYVSRRSVEATQPEKLIQLFRVTQLALELINQDFECSEDELEKLKATMQINSNAAGLEKELKNMSTNMNQVVDQLALTAQDLKESDLRLREMEQQRDMMVEQCHAVTQALHSAEEELAQREREALRSAEEALALAQGIELEKDMRVQEEIEKRQECLRQIEYLKIQVDTLRIEGGANIQDVLAIEGPPEDPSRQRTSPASPSLALAKKRAEQHERDIEALHRDIRLHKLKAAEAEAQLAEVEATLVAREDAYLKIRAQLYSYEKGVDGLLQSHKENEEQAVQLKFREDECKSLKMELNETHERLAGYQDYMSSLRDLGLRLGSNEDELDSLKPSDVKLGSLEASVQRIHALEAEIETLGKDLNHWKRKSYDQDRDLVRNFDLTEVQEGWLLDYVDRLKFGKAGPCTRGRCSDHDTQTHPPPTTTDMATEATPWPSRDVETDITPRQTAIMGTAMTPSHPRDVASSPKRFPDRLSPATSPLRPVTTEASTPGAEADQNLRQEYQKLVQELEESKRVEEDLRRAKEEVEEKLQTLSASMTLDIQQVLKDVMGTTFAHGVTYTFPIEVAPGAQTESSTAIQLMPEGSSVQPSASQPLGGLQLQQLLQLQRLTSLTPQQLEILSKLQSEAQDHTQESPQPSRSQLSALLMRVMGALDRQPSGEEEDSKTMQTLKEANEAITNTLSTIQQELQASNEARRGTEARLQRAEEERDRYKSVAAQMTATSHSNAQLRAQMEGEEAVQRATLLHEELIHRDQRIVGLEGELANAFAELEALKEASKQQQQDLASALEAKEKLEVGVQIQKQASESVSDKLESMTAQLEVSKAKVEEYEIILDKWDLMSEETIVKKMADNVRRMTILRINEVTHARQYKLLDSRLSSALSDLNDTKQNAIQVEKELRERWVMLEESYKQQQFDLEACRKVINKATKDWQLYQNSQVHTLTEQNRLLVETEQQMVADHEDWGRLKTRCSDLQKKVETKTIEVGKWKVKAEALDQLLGDVKTGNTYIREFINPHSKLIELEVEHGEAKQQIAINERRSKVAEDEAQELQTHLQQAKEEIITLRKQLRDGLDEKQSLLKRLEGSISQTEAEDLQRKMAEAEKASKRWELEANRHRQTTEVATHQCVAVETFRDQLQLEIQSLNDIIKSMETKDDEGLLLARLHMQLMDYKIKDKSKEKKISRMELDYKRMQAECKVFSLRMASQSSEMGHLYADYIHTAYHTTQLNRKLQLELKGCSTMAKTEAIINDMRKMRQDLELAKIAKEDIQQKCEETDETLAKLKIEKDAAEEQLKDAREPDESIGTRGNRIADLIRKITELKVNEMRQDRKNEQLREREAYLQKILKQNEETIRELEESKVVLEMENMKADDVYAAKVADLHARIMQKEDMAVQQMAPPSDNIASLEGRAEGSAGHCHHHVVKIQDLNQTVNRHLSTILTLRERIAETDSKVAELERGVHKKEDTVNALRRELVGEREKSANQLDTVRDMERRRQEQASTLANQNLQTIQRLLKQKEEALHKCQESLYTERKKHLADKQVDTARIQQLHDRLFKENDDMITRFQNTINTITEAPMIAPTTLDAPVKLEEELRTLKKKMQYQEDKWDTEINKVCNERDQMEIKLREAVQARERCEEEMRALKRYSRIGLHIDPHTGARSDASLLAESFTLATQTSPREDAPQPALRASVEMGIQTEGPSIAAPPSPSAAGEEASTSQPVDPQEGKVEPRPVDPNKLSAVELQQFNEMDGWRREAQRLKEVAADRLARLQAMETKMQRMTAKQMALASGQVPPGMVTKEEVQKLMFDRDVAITDMTNQLASLEEQNERMSQSMQALMLREEELSNEIRAKGVMAATLEEEVQLQQSNLLRKTTELANLKLSEKSFKQKLQEVETQNAKLQGGLSALRAKLVDRAEGEAEKRVVHETQMMASEALVQEHTRTKQALKTLQRRFDQLYTDVETRIENEKVLQQENHHMRQELQQGRDRVAEKEQEAWILGRQVQNLKEVMALAMVASKGSPLEQKMKEEEEKYQRLEQQLQSQRTLSPSQQGQPSHSQHGQAVHDGHRDDQDLSRKDPSQLQTVPGITSPDQKPFSPSRSATLETEELSLTSLAQQQTQQQATESIRTMNVATGTAGIQIPSSLPHQGSELDDLLQVLRQRWEAAEEAAFRNESRDPQLHAALEALSLRAQELESRNAAFTKENELLKKEKLEWEVAQRELKIHLRKLDMDAGAKGHALAEELERKRRQRDAESDVLKKQLEELTRFKVESEFKLLTARKEKERLAKALDTKKTEAAEEISKLKEKHLNQLSKFEDNAARKWETQVADKDMKLKAMQKELKQIKENTQKDRMELQKQLHHAQAEASTAKATMEKMVIKHRKEVESIFDRKTLKEAKDRQTKEEKAKAAAIGRKEKRDDTAELLATVERERREVKEQAKLEKAEREMRLRDEKEQELARRHEVFSMKYRDENEKFKAKIKAMSAKLQERGKALEVALEEAVGLKTKLEETEAAVKEKEQIVRLMEAEKKIPKEQRLSAQTLRQYKLTIMQLEEDKDKLQRIIEVDKEIEIGNLRSDLKRSRDEIYTLESEVSRLQVEKDRPEYSKEDAAMDKGMGRDIELEDARKKVTAIEDKLLAEKSLVHQLRFETESQKIKVHRLQKHLDEVLQTLKDVAEEGAEGGGITPQPETVVDKEKEKDLKRVIERLKRVIAQQKEEMAHAKDNAVSNVKYMECLKELKNLRQKVKQDAETINTLKEAADGPGGKDKQMTRLAEQCAGLSKQLKKEKGEATKAKRALVELKEVEMKLRAAVEEKTGHVPDFVIGKSPAEVESMEAKFNGRLGILENEKRLLEDTNADLKSEIGKLESQLKMGEIKESAHPPDLKASADKGKEVTSSDDKVQREIESLKKANTAYKLKTEDLESALGRKEEESRKLQSELRTLLQTYQLTLDEKEGLEYENARIREQIAKASFDGKMVDEIQALKNKNVELAKRNRNLERVNVDLEGRLLFGEGQAKAEKTVNPIQEVRSRAPGHTSMSTTKAIKSQSSSSATSAPVALPSSSSSAPHTSHLPSMESGGPSKPIPLTASRLDMFGLGKLRSSTQSDSIDSFISSSTDSSFDDSRDFGPRPRHSEPSSSMDPLADSMRAPTRRSSSSSASTTASDIIKRYRDVM